MPVSRSGGIPLFKRRSGRGRYSPTTTASFSQATDHDFPSASPRATNHLDAVGLGSAYSQLPNDELYEQRRASKCP
jgi:hypothetical protein